MTVAELIRNNGTDPEIKDRPFILLRDGAENLSSITYGEYLDQCLAYGNLIRELKQSRPDKESNRFHVGVFMQNIPEFFFLLGGCSFTNTTLVGINNAQIGEKLAFDINNIDLHVLFVDHAPQPGTSGTFLDTVLDAQREHGFSSLKRDTIFVTDAPVPGNYEDISPVSAKLRACLSTLPGFRPEVLDPALPAVIIFTSGTTGAPKGIEVTWQKLFDVGLTSTRILNYTRNDVGYVSMPVNHSNSLYLNIMPALLNGARILLRRRFSVRNFIGDIETAGATVWNCVGDPVQYVINHIHETVGKKADFSHLPIRTVVSTGTNALNRAIFTRMFGLELFTEVFGSTEAGAIAAVDADTPEYS
ncbi:MAG: AMP-binding protein, partial [Desulfomonilia bacterium]|nr:AMP-binding protein [Desulfomonilia bacterium]